MQTIQWAPFSQKHIDYIKKAIYSKMSVAEGSVRAGKTIDNCIIACMHLEVCEDKIHLASGSTLPNAKLNIGYCNGFGLECLFKGRCRWGKFKDNEALYIKTKTGEKVVIFAGGGKADSYKKILGNSFGLWIATEINEHYDSEDSKTSFIKVAMARQIASKEPKILWDLNPSSPRHKIYEWYIDKYAKDGLLGGYNYGHFTLNDNKSLSEQRKEEIKSQYTEGSVWYKRDIQGLRVTAQGLIFEDFANNTEDYIVDEDWLETHKITHTYIGIDFGGNGSAHTFVCTGFTYGLKEVVVLESERIDNRQSKGLDQFETMTPDKLGEKFVIFLEKCYNKYGRNCRCFADSAEQTLIAGLRSAMVKNHIYGEIVNAKKNEIKERIKLLLRLMSLKKFKVMRHCKTVIDAYSTCVYNGKEGHEDERLDNGTSDIDTCDATEYSIEPHLNELKIL